MIHHMKNMLLQWLFYHWHHVALMVALALLALAITCIVMGSLRRFLPSFILGGAAVAGVSGYSWPKAVPPEIRYVEWIRYVDRIVTQGSIWPDKPLFAFPKVINFPKLPDFKFPEIKVVKAEPAKEFDEFNAQCPRCHRGLLLRYESRNKDFICSRCKNIFSGFRALGLGSPNRH